MGKLIPTRVVTNTIPELVAADATLLADPADAPKAHLITSAFTPGLNSDFSAMTEATFTGSAAKSATAGAQQAYVDPVTSKYVVQLQEPAGGWTWECTADPAATETILGVCVTNQAGDVTYGSMLLDDPVPISAAGQAVPVPWIRIELPIGAWGV